MNAIVIVISLFEDTWSPIILTITDSFFNAAFYFFRKWPYDKFNLAFMEKNMAYMLGYGFFVSFITNLPLPPSLSIGCYLILGQWMIINAILTSPPEIEFTSWGQIYRAVTNYDERRKLINGYNIHRRKLRD